MFFGNNSSSKRANDNDGKVVNEKGGKANNDPDADIKLNKDDILRAMQDIQQDETMPSYTKNVISKISDQMGKDQVQDGVDLSNTQQAINNATGMLRFNNQDDSQYVSAQNLKVNEFGGFVDERPGTPTSYKSARDPQEAKVHPSRNLLAFLCGLNVILGILYLHWRFTKSIMGLEKSWFAWFFLLGEMLVMISAWQSHCSRFFPVKRPKCTMDELVSVDRSMSKKTAVTVFMPTAGEKIEVLRMALMGNLSMKIWKSDFDTRDLVRVIVLDEKRRPEVITLIALCYQLATLFVEDENIRLQMRRDRVPESSVRALYGFYIQCSAQFGRRYSAVYNEVFEICEKIDKLCVANKIPEDWDGIELPTGRRIEPTMTVDNGRLPRLREDFDEVKNIIRVIYFSRRNPGEPWISPKSGNMNSVLFPEDPIDADVLGPSSFVVINDARHAFEPEYLNRVQTAFWKLTKTDGVYRYQIAKKVAFCQVPQRFRDRGDGDPFGNQSAVMFDVTNVGRDGIGGVMSCGQGSMWRVDVIRDGVNVDGTRGVDPLEVRSLIGSKIGFSQQSRIEDTLTSIRLFSRGFISVYMNQKDEHLGWCSQEPDNMEWRIKQLFRWHFGAVELFQMGPMAMQEGRFPSIWHRVYTWEACTYFFQAAAAQVFLLMPAIYCFTWDPPFNTHKTEFVMFLVPYFITAILPTIIGLGWRKVNPDLALREEQVWMATSYVQLYALVQAIWKRIQRATISINKDADGQGSNWSLDCPTWPLYAMFFLQFAAMITTSYRWFSGGFEQPWVWMSSMGASMLATYMLWPVVVRGLKLPPLSKFYLRYTVLGLFILVVAAWQS